MNRTALFLVAVATPILSVQAQITNNPGGVDPFVLNGLSFSGSTGEVAAAVSGISSFESSNSSFTGGTGGVQSGSSSQDASGAAGISISDVTLSELEAAVIEGGQGGTAEVTVGSATVNATADGGSGIYFSPASAAQKLSLDGGSVSGGAAGTVIGEPANKLFASGGNAINMASGGTLELQNVELTGGQGGNANSTGGFITARGGRGVSVYGSYTLDPIADGVSITGGQGGDVTNLSEDQGVQAMGGDAIFISSGSSQAFSFTGGALTGGAGGYASFNSDEVSDPLSEVNYFGEAYGGAESYSGARGGNAFRYFNDEYVQYGVSVDIDAGSFIGGAGGVSTNSGTGDSVADGGHGIFTDFADVNISGGTFQGGAAGTSNGEEAEAGYGVYVRDGSLTISGGTFSGNGLWFESHYYDSTANISTGTFGDVSFISTYDEFYTTDHTTTENISGGSFGNVFFGGSSIHDGNITGGSFAGIEVGGQAQNVVDIDGASVGTLKGSGSNAVSVVNVTGSTVDALEIEGASDNTFTLTGAGLDSILVREGDLNTININDNGSALNNVSMFGGKATLNFNTDHMINSIAVSNGVLDVVGSDLSIASGNTYRLMTEGAVLNAEALTVDSGELDVGFGSLNVTSNLTVKSGSALSTSIETDGAGVKGGMINAGSAMFEDGVAWTVVNADTNMTADHLSDGILLASATESNITHSLEYTDFTMENNPEWLLGINGVTNYNDGSSYVLKATYGQLALDKIFEDYPDMAGAMTELAPIVAADPELAAYVGSAWSSQEAAAADMTEGFARTPEMASALMGLQGIFADQIKGRTRGNLRYKQFGSKTTYAPSGPRGPQDWYDNTVQWTKDVLPSWDARKAAREASDNMPAMEYEGEPSDVSKAYNSSTTGKSSDYAEFKKELRAGTPGDLEPIEVPETWQVWGGAYGSAVNQESTSGHEGYQATVAGGMVGVDKRFEKMLAGLAAGYARTMLDGRGGNDGDADTLYASAYWAHNSESLYIDASVTYGFNDVSTEGVDSIGYEADYNAHTLGIGVGIGYGISFMKDKWLLTPEASYLGSLYSRESYTEKSSLASPFPNKDYDSYDEWSHLTSIGATLSMIGVIESFDTELEFQPEFRAHWLHEFNADMDDDSYVMVGGTGDPIAVALQAREEDLVRLGTGIRFSEWENDTTEFSLDLDGAFGADYHNVMVSGKILHRF
ncbi:autotransporter outer membrane beta-barrel domain-containing protein [Pontiella agarivorans]|uniref:Autotransporter outer membrane beta-barrel domain-containing protein n=1 Tax=Pontiella agarivorans TaxID=3038953 RepID=A0ABU5MUM1_9BACT|nr:autotransporter outer membrane beta-barrel domain-containing protein [Pontiella agarivorans]MDZ8117919.1 autotransporter outer membrane beta-barrel domain-containing protein [Pontiella agarivorans]